MRFSVFSGEKIVTPFSTFANIKGSFRLIWPRPIDYDRGFEETENKFSPK